MKDELKVLILINICLWKPQNFMLNLMTPMIFTKKGPSFTESNKVTSEIAQGLKQDLFQQVDAGGIKLNLQQFYGLPMLKLLFLWQLA